MKTTSAELLEFEPLRELVGRYISSPLGRRELDQMGPGVDRRLIEESLLDAGEAVGYLRASSHPQAAGRGAALRLNFSTLPDLTEPVHKLRIEGACLDPKEIFEMLAMLDRASDVRSILAAAAPRFPRLGARAERIGEFRLILRDLDGKILPDGTVSDDASVALRRIRRDIERQRKSIQESLERFLRVHREEGILQEEFVTIRNERFVVPLIAGQRRKVDGVIHGASSSGHTLFVEPLETIELNNELVRLAEEEAQEVHRILLEMTQRLRGHAETIQHTVLVLGELEFIFAKARFGADFNCVIPRFCADASPHLLLKDARHPLLEDVLRRQRKAVVPVSLELDHERRTLVISGPNTGGKTVALKTVGLLVLMAQAGLPVPAAEAEFPMFEQVLADIGDQQSIQESLSTFSAHVSHIREMALDVTADSLVLLDELGAATDPEEGGALGLAIVDHFRAAGAYTLVSTHLMALKVYGASRTGVVNASMGFDEATLEPTYELRVGAPGKSAGLEIATRLGMPDHIMRHARQALGSREHDVARFISELHQQLEQMGNREQELRAEQSRLAVREKELEREWGKRESEKLKELERRCELVLQKFDEQAEGALQKISEALGGRKAAEQAARRVAKTKRELREEFSATVLSTQEDARVGELGLGRPKIEEGVRVRLKGLRDLARVRRKLDAGRIEVEAGFMRMQVSIDDVLEVLPALEPASKLPSHVSFRPAPQLNPMFQEINVIGRHAEDACEEVERFLDKAVMATAARVRIVHGHGMGILKKAIWNLLSQSPHVEKFYSAQQYEGGTGATIAELKE